MLLFTGEPVRQQIEVVVKDLSSPWQTCNWSWNENWLAVALDESQRKSDKCFKLQNLQKDAAVIANSQFDTHAIPTMVPLLAWWVRVGLNNTAVILACFNAVRCQLFSWDFVFQWKKRVKAVEENRWSSKNLQRLLFMTHIVVLCNAFQFRARSRRSSWGAEILRFINFLGYGDVYSTLWSGTYHLAGFKGMSQRARTNNWTCVQWLRNSKVLDHGGKLCSVRSQLIECVFRLQLFCINWHRKIGFEVHPQHPIFAWAFVHSAWIFDSVWSHSRCGHRMSLISGHKLQLKNSVKFGCPVMVYVGGQCATEDRLQKWRKGIFLGKSFDQWHVPDISCRNVETDKVDKGASFQRGKSTWRSTGQVTVLFLGSWKETLGNRIVPTFAQ